MVFVFIELILIELLPHLETNPQPQQIIQHQARPQHIITNHTKWLNYPLLVATITQQCKHVIDHTIFLEFYVTLLAF